MTDLLEGRRVDCFLITVEKAAASIALIGPDKRRYGCSSEKNVCKHGLLQPHHPLQMTMLVTTPSSLAGRSGGQQASARTSHTERNDANSKRMRCYERGSEGPSTCAMGTTIHHTERDRCDKRANAMRRTRSAKDHPPKVDAHVLLSALQPNPKRGSM
jgi:hypothetical protein